MTNDEEIERLEGLLEIFEDQRDRALFEYQDQCESVAALKSQINELRGNE